MTIRMRGVTVSINRQSEQLTVIHDGGDFMLCNMMDELNGMCPSCKLPMLQINDGRAVTLRVGTDVELRAHDTYGGPAISVRGTISYVFYDDETVYFELERTSSDSTLSRLVSAHPYLSSGSDVTISIRDATLDGKNYISLAAARWMLDVAGGLEHISDERFANAISIAKRVVISAIHEHE